MVRLVALGTLLFLARNLVEVEIPWTSEGKVPSGRVEEQ